MRWPWQKKPIENADEVRAILHDYSITASRDEGVKAMATYKGVAVEAFCAGAADWFKECGGKAFVTMEMTDKRDGSRYSVTMQKAGERTPAARIGELQEGIKRWAAECAECNGTGEVWSANVAKPDIGPCPACADIRALLTV